MVFCQKKLKNYEKIPKKYSKNVSKIEVKKFICSQPQHQIHFQAYYF